MDEYIIRYKAINGALMTVRVQGSQTFYNLEGLDADVTYTVDIITVNSNGNSMPNPLAEFSTSTRGKVVNKYL